MQCKIYVAKLLKYAYAHMMSVLLLKMTSCMVYASHEVSMGSIYM